MEPIHLFNFRLRDQSILMPGAGAELIIGYENPCVILFVLFIHHMWLRIRRILILFLWHSYFQTVQVFLYCTWLTHYNMLLLLFIQYVWYIWLGPSTILGFSVFFTKHVSQKPLFTLFPLHAAHNLRNSPAAFLYSMWLQNLAFNVYTLHVALTLWKSNSAALYYIWFFLKKKLIFVISRLHVAQTLLNLVSAAFTFRLARTRQNPSFAVFILHVSCMKRRILLLLYLHCMCLLHCRIIYLLISLHLALILQNPDCVFTMPLVRTLRNLCIAVFCCMWLVL